MTTTARPLDVEVENHFTIYLVRPVTDEARGWLEDHLTGEVTYWGDAIVCEHRFVGDLVQGMEQDGLVVGAA